MNSKIPSQGLFHANGLFIFWGFILFPSKTWKHHHFWVVAEKLPNYLNFSLFSLEKNLFFIDF